MLRENPVDDHAVVRRGLVDLINDQPGLRACCESAASSGHRHFHQRHSPGGLAADTL